tara:strand:- start:1103 stop:1288 length:186 start_codon:yes stop_codon:yes gene_type:complete
MGEAKRREKLGLPPREIKATKREINSTGKLTQILNKYPFLPYIFGISLLLVLILDLINYYN